MRFHVVGLPHTQTTKKYLSCAYTQKIIKFCKMLKLRGHEVILYSGNKNEAECDEHVVTAVNPEPDDSSYVYFPFDVSNPKWVDMNNRTIAEIMRRKKDRDIICIIAGWCQKPISDAFPGMISVEYGIGYAGSYLPYRVFESYAWMHSTYAANSHDPGSVDGKFFDAVIPNAVDPADFEVGKPGEYYVYLGRMIDRKGINIVHDIEKQTGKTVLYAGTGNPIPGTKHLGVLNTTERKELLSHAIALLCPTLYIEPFGGVAVEAMMSGVPVISTDWGAFTETVVHGVTGYRCRTMDQFVFAMDAVCSLNHYLIRQYAVDNYGLERVSKMYHEYFQMIDSLWDKGFYQEKKRYELSWLSRSMVIDIKR